MLALLLAAHVRLLSFNDFHGQLGPGKMLDGKPAGSAPVFLSYLRQRADKGTVIVHAGDLIGASPPESSLLGDVPTIDFMNLACAKIRCVGTAGNHEFDRGADALVRLMKKARYQTVLANVVHADSGTPLFPPYRIETLNGVKVAFIGAVLRDAPTIVTPSGVAGVRFLDEPTAVNPLAKEARAKGAQAVVLLIHQGGEQAAIGAPLTGAPIEDVLSRLEGVDVVVSGHTHRFTQATSHGMLITQSFSSGVAFTQIDLEVADGHVTSKAELVKTYAEGVKPALDAARIVNRAQAKVAPLVRRVVATAAADVSREENEAGESPMGDLIADAMREATGSDVAFMNPGGIRGELRAGEVTWGKAFAVQPFSNDLVVLELSGADVLAMLRQQWGKDQPFPRILKPSGLSYSWSPDHALHDVRVGGEPIDAARKYKVTVNSFLAAGGDKFDFLAQAKRLTVAGVDLDALVKHLAKLPKPFSLKADGRIQRAN